MGAGNPSFSRSLARSLAAGAGNSEDSVFAFLCVGESKCARGSASALPVPRAGLTTNTVCTKNGTKNQKSKVKSPKVVWIIKSKSQRLAAAASVARVKFEAV